MDSTAKLVGWCIGLIVLIALVLLLDPFVSVGAGERAVVTHFGAVTGELGPGLHTITPIVTAVTIINVQTQKESTKASSASADLQTVDTDLAVNYNVDPTKVTDLFTRVGVGYQSTIIDPAVQEVVKAVTANYTAEQLITERAQVTQDIQTELAQKLELYDILVTNVNVTDFNFSDQFNQAIESKVTAQQNALAADNKVQQTEAEASSTIIAAEAQAEAIKIQAQAINSEGGADYVELQAIKAWDGHYPSTYLGSSSALPIINIGSVGK